MIPLLGSDKTFQNRSRIVHTVNLIKNEQKSNRHNESRNNLKDKTQKIKAIND